MSPKARTVGVNVEAGLTDRESTYVPSMNRHWIPRSPSTTVSRRCQVPVARVIGYVRTVSVPPLRVQTRHVIVFGGSHQSWVGMSAVPKDGSQFVNVSTAKWPPVPQAAT